MKRIDFIKNSAITSAGFIILPSSVLLRSAKKIRLGFIGTGLRGQDHVDLSLRRDDVEIVSICDIDSRMIKATLALFAKAGKPAPKIITGDVYAYRKLLDQKDIDAVIIATPWEWHAPMSIDALERGKKVGCEVMMGVSLEDHWNVLKACEKNNGHLMMLENVCYRRDVMAVMNMVRQNILGEMVHLQGGYQHDLRGVKFNNGIEPYNSGVEFV